MLVVAAAKRWCTVAMRTKLEPPYHSTLPLSLYCASARICSDGFDDLILHFLTGTFPLVSSPAVMHERQRRIWGRPNYTDATRSKLIDSLYESQLTGPTEPNVVIGK